MLYEYPGYGLCENRRLSEEGVYYNIRVVYNYVRKELNYNPEEIVLYGHSLGTGPSIDLAADDKYPAAALILQAPFLSILRTVADVQSTPFFDYFPNKDKVSKICTQVLIIHGTKDKIVTIQDGEELSKLIKDDYLYEFFKIAEGDHNDIIKNHKAKVYKKLREFLNHVTKINFSLNSGGSKHDINSDFFKKLHPPEDDGNNLQSDKNANEEDNFRNIVIRNYIETDNNNISHKQVEMKVVKEEGKDIHNGDIILEIVSNEKEDLPIEEHKDDV